MIEKINRFLNGAFPIPPMEINLPGGKQLRIYSRLGPGQVDFLQNRHCVLIRPAQCAGKYDQLKWQDSQEFHPRL